MGERQFIVLIPEINVFLYDQDYRFVTVKHHVIYEFHLYIHLNSYQILLLLSLHKTLERLVSQLA